MSTVHAQFPPLQAGFHVLGNDFYSLIQPTPLTDVQLVAWNSTLAAQLGLPDALAQQAATRDLLAGNASLSSPAAITTVYSGHQFGAWAGQLGDGRAILLGEWQGQEIQLKGAGRTPYSRRGDGRAVLRSSIREYLCSEAMHGLGIPTTRALALVSSSEEVWRETVETAAVVTRVAPSFLRFGHFEHFYHAQRHPQLQQLADYAIQRYFPDCKLAENPYQALLDNVIARTAELIAAWQAVGFCHGVMNSDNMSLLGLTIDYGPYGFLDAFNANHICNHSDDHGRYTYANQPEIGLFNLQCLAQALLPLLDYDAAIAALNRYQSQFEAAYLHLFWQKLGLTTHEADDEILLNCLLDLMQANHTDWTLFWRKLGDFASHDHALNAPVRDLFIDRPAFDAWAADYRRRLQREGSQDQVRQARMQRINPKYILRNHLAEQAIRSAQAGDFSEIERLRQLLSRPFDEQPEQAAYAALPPAWANELSVSCSS